MIHVLNTRRGAPKTLLAPQSAARRTFFFLLLVFGDDLVFWAIIGKFSGFCLDLDFLFCSRFRLVG